MASRPEERDRGGRWEARGRCKTITPTGSKGNTENYNWMRAVYSVCTVSGDVPNDMPYYDVRVQYD